MSIFVRRDPRALACADPSWPSALYLMLRRHVIAVAVILSSAVAFYAVNVAIGFHAAAQVQGTIRGLPVYANVTIVRDARDIPHIHARNLHDLFFADGFVQGEDRLFQLDVTRRYAYGTLAEVFGAKALAIDERLRAVDIRDIAARQWRGSDAQTRAALRAFASGINAAAAREPLPVEFRMLLYRPAPWTPQDSIAVSLVAALELGDMPYDVLARDEEWRQLGAACFNRAFPLTDERYDVSIDGRFLHERAPAPSSCSVTVGLANHGADTKPGSNAWAAGARLTATHHALIANDPHVDLTIPGIWYAIDLDAPGLHAAGAVIPGLPGVALGHNERLAWAVTDGDVATTVLYRLPKLPHSDRHVERFNVRFGKSVERTYVSTHDAFEIGDEEEHALVRWPPYWQAHSSIQTLLQLDRAQNIAQAAHVLRTYRGAPQNFILAGTSGGIAYQLAGAIPDDPAWGRYAEPARAYFKPLGMIPFDELPHRLAGPGAILLSANNRMYGARYPYRLSAAFEPPYRAYRIAQLLHARTRYDLAYFERMQLDVCSPVDAEIARDLVRLSAGDPTTRTSARRNELAKWDGCFSPQSKDASLEYAVRSDLLNQTTSLAALLADLRRPSGSSPNFEAAVEAELRPFYAQLRPWAQVGRIQVDHPLSSAWYGMLRGITLPGDGNEYTIHLQEPGFAQGFRAVWDVGNWDAGGLVLPSGESGEPASHHYDDLAHAWIDGKMIPLPFSAAAVNHAAIAKLILAS